MYHGAHHPLTSEQIFDAVQDIMKKNSGRSMTLQPHPAREYLLKWLVRCAYCGMPIWAQTYKSGKTYYREHRGSRSLEICPAHGGAINCKTIDDQIIKVIESIELGPTWLEEVISIISLKDEVARVKKQRINAQERLRRMAKAFTDGLFPD
jgi:hypothetical protein